MEALPITVVIINFRTPDLINRAIVSLRRYYPSISVLLVDNGSNDGVSLQALETNQRLFPDSTAILVNRQNRHHGPAMDQAVHAVQTPFVLFLDSDCEVIASGFIEQMLSQLLQRTQHYAIGKEIFMNHRGFDIPEQPGAIPYIRPICMMVKRECYLELPPFERHGAPCLENMRRATERGFVLVDFSIDQFVRHVGRGTAAQYGYRLGMRGKINFLLNRLGF